MESYKLKNLIITLFKPGSSEFSKVSFPVRYGRFSEIRTLDYKFQFNLNGEIKYIQGQTQSWPHPAEWLKRTAADDWIYYSGGDYKDIYDLYGEYYFPYLSYPSNSILNGSPFDDDAVRSAIQSWPLLLAKIKELPSHRMPKSLRDFLHRVTKNDEKTLEQKSFELHHLIGGRISVLPPDTRHVDYEVIPVIVADGCLYHCGFCRVKSEKNFNLRPEENIIKQIKDLKEYYGMDLPNYNAIFLGEHDALASGQEILEFTARKAYEIFDFKRSYLKGANLFLFGSMDSLIRSKEALFEALNILPFFTYINIGLESADPITLSKLEKPLNLEMVQEAFNRTIVINKRYERIEVTVNFVIGNDLPPTHLPSLLDLMRDGLKRCSDKGTVYLSPIVEEETRDKERSRELLRQFNQVKAQSLLPTFIYLIQRL